MVFEYLQGRKLHNPSGQPMPVPGHLHIGKVFHSVQRAPPVFQLVCNAPGSAIGNHCKEPSSLFLHSLFRYLYTVITSLLSLFFFRLNSNSSLSLPTYLSPDDLNLFMLCASCYMLRTLSGLVLTETKSGWLLLASGIMYLWEESPSHYEKLALRQTTTVLADSILPTWHSNMTTKKRIHTLHHGPFLQLGTLMHRGSSFPLHEKRFLNTQNKHVFYSYNTIKCLTKLVRNE